MLIFDCNSESDLSNWYILDDVVMGGRSSGEFFINDDGHGVFQGTVSLENNGGFSSVRYQPPSTLDISKHQKVVIRLRGDGKSYQFRTKSDVNERFSYITTIKTSGEWEDIEVNLKDMYPSFRGRKLDMPNFPAEQLSEIAFLIGNKKAEGFKLEIDEISLN
ncbi:MAG: CIA30 family protein [Saprospiraceae bacterium]